MLKAIKDGIYGSVSGKIGGMFLKKTFSDLKAKLDYNNKGGALFLGVNKAVIKAHGSSKRLAFKNAVLQAVDYAGFNIADRITAKLETAGETGEVNQ